MPTFTTRLLAAGPNNVGIQVPEDVVLSFGVGKRVPVVVTIDGGYTYRNTISSMGGRYLISFNAETRAKTGLGAGDEIEVTLEHDATPRTVEMPEALRAAVGADADAVAAWQKLSPSAQKEHARAIDDAKGDDTRARRVAKVAELLSGRS